MKIQKKIEVKKKMEIEREEKIVTKIESGGERGTISSERL